MDKPVKETKRIVKHNKRESKDQNGKVGITKKEFLAILDKASQPIKREPESDSGKSET
jgi:hypothetical protein